MTATGTEGREARRLAKKALGKPLPSDAEVHHIDGDCSNNKSSNLVICENKVYHMLLHRRADALKVCGHASWRVCSFCKEYDDPKNLFISGDEKKIYHRKCSSKYSRERYQPYKFIAMVGGSSD